MISSLKYLKMRPRVNLFYLQDARNMQLLLKAIKSQTDFTISAITGHGIDCHLLGLKMVIISVFFGNCNQNLKIKASNSV